ncbi:MAG: GNAT family N-acetyltransferase [Chitinophaga sp.]|uniref:bifunctional GNAT family N-acetyltransferase/carbon-nitrogen hydrolase family protein n=1 Tax=Chitinophaga sp. TaxID=1869181 RepID=UPI0025C46FAA|nr:bifunctional GNAT family N-acetyltransferase/carbon-nitrogen hydrolase family protein [Chitinophaga sp.]MBV8253784.1 GNAT family N-acetyltransferase [Chitinophaga sp.]
MSDIVEIRNLTAEDYFDLKESMVSAYADMHGSYWPEPTIRHLINIFPEGQIAVTVNDRVVGCALSIIVDYNKFGDDHTYEQVTGYFTFNTHNPKGDILYGIEVFVHPDFRGQRLARRLYDARKNLCEQRNLEGIVAGGRIPNFEKYANKMTPRQYIEKVRDKEIYDPTLTFQFSNDFQVTKILRNYLPTDEASKGFATLLKWYNIYYEPDKDNIRNTKSTVRIGLVQWQMRDYRLEGFLQQVEFFIDAVSDYGSDFVVFPELFNAPLMAEFNQLDPAGAIRGVAKYTEQIREAMQQFAVSYNVNVICGSMPIVIDEALYNVSYLCRRDGTHEEYTKIHPTPSEVAAWGIKGGNEIKVFDTDCGKIGIQVCYDVEFPEPSRILAEQGMQILFVPFMTDTQHAFNRVRFCAQARAIENECYVAIAGCIGNLPKVNNMDLQYAQSCVLTPSDFQFPVTGIVADATPNTEMVVIADVDLVLLKELHAFGSVQTMKDIRNDLYKVVEVKK